MTAKRTCLTLLLGVAVFGFGAVAAQGGIWFPNQVNIWQDNDWESIVNRDDSTTEVTFTQWDPDLGEFVEVTETRASLTPGDWLVGMYHTESVGEVTPPASPLYPDTQFTAVFLLQVDSITAGGGQYVNGDRLHFEPLPYVDVAENVGAGDGFDDNWQLYGLLRTDPGTIISAYDDPVPLTVVDPDTEDNAPPSDGILPELLTAQDGLWLWELGFTGAADTDIGPNPPLGGNQPASANEFWRADLNSLAFPPAPTGFSLEFGASVNRTVTHGGPPLVPHNHVSTVLGPSIWPDPFGVQMPLITSEVQILGDRGEHDVGDFDLATDADAFLVPIPEPISIFVWAGLILLGASVAWRRRAAR